MGIGPLSEWVTAFAEIAAVSLHYFCPFMTKNKKNVKRHVI